MFSFFEELTLEPKELSELIQLIFELIRCLSNTLDIDTAHTEHVPQLLACSIPMISMTLSASGILRAPYAPARASVEL